MGMAPLLLMSLLVVEVDQVEDQVVDQVVHQVVDQVQDTDEHAMQAPHKDAHQAAWWEQGQSYLNTLRW